MLDPESRSTSFIVLTEREVTATLSENAMGTVVGIPSTIPSNGKVSYARRWYFEVEINKIRGGIFIGKFVFLFLKVRGHQCRCI